MHAEALNACDIAQMIAHAKSRVSYLSLGFEILDTARVTSARVHA
jgi:hypothetical protein